MVKATNIKVSQIDNRNLSVDYPYLALLVGLILLHLFCITKVGLAQVLSVFEALVVFLFLVQNKLSSAVLLFGVFILTNYDIKFFFAIPVGVDEVYNVSFLPAASVYFYLFISFAIFVISVIRIIKYKIKFDNPFVKFALFTLIVSVPMGILSFVSDGISFIAITRDIKTCVIPALWIISFYFLLVTDNKFLYRYEKLIIHILLAYVVAGILTASVGFFLVRYERENILYLPLASFFFSSIILFLNRLRLKSDRIFVIVLYAFTVIFQLFCDSCLAGKSWFVFVTVIIVGLYYFVQRVAIKGVMVKIVAVIVIVIAIGAFSSKIISFVNNSENGKLLEFVSLFEGAQSGNLDDVDDSAQFRFLEFITISDYYRNHPQFLLLGKGIGGGVPNIGFFEYSETAFSDDQYKINRFSVMHESLNVIYLKYGLIGLIFFSCVLLSGFKRIKYDSLFYIGIIWLFFYWSYSVNLLFLGLPAFAIAYQKLERCKINKY